jgi:hypothetical protein
MFPVTSGSLGSTFLSGFWPEVQQPISINMKGFKKFYNVTYDDKGRRHWDTSEPMPKKAEEKVQEKSQKILPPVDYSRPLETRQAEVNLEAKIGRHSFKPDDTESSKYLGFYCKACDVSYNDSNSWLEHLNSYNHIRITGTIMKVEDVGIDRVKEKLGRNQAQRRNPVEEMKKRLALLKETSDEPYKKLKRTPIEEC